MPSRLPVKRRLLVLPLALALLLGVAPARAVSPTAFPASEFPAGYEAYHTYAEMEAELDQAVAGLRPSSNPEASDRIRRLKTDLARAREHIVRAQQREGAINSLDRLDAERDPRDYSGQHMRFPKRRIEKGGSGRRGGNCEAPGNEEGGSEGLNHDANPKPEWLAKT